MERERAPQDEPDAEELSAAEALSQALEGGSAGTHLPEQALETAALLRFSGSRGELRSDRRSEIRAALLASLPARAPAPRRRWSIFTLWLPAAVGASLAAVFASRALLGPAAPEATALSQTEAEAPAAAAAPPASLAEAEGAAAPRAAELRSQAKGRAQLTELGPAELAQLSAATRSYRETRIAPLVDGSLARIHDGIDEATSAAELERLAASAGQRGAVSSERSIGSAPGDGRAPDLLRQDLFCRLAEAALRVGQPDQALEWAKRGIALDGPPNPLLAQLMAIDGQARASLGDRLGAARSYLRALEINETLLDEHLDGP
jgi:hypothetical protein